VGRVWVSVLGEEGEVFYEADMPSCCRVEARSAEESFECLSCGAAWREPDLHDPEGYAFTEPKERRGAA
jgi:hypothetical protein